MPGIFDQYVILTDLDGTVFDDDLNIHPKDMEAIRHFIRCGGTFGVSTGRVMVSALPLIAKLPVNAPCVMCNGGVIMDTVTGEYKHKTIIDPSARAALKQVMARFPNLRASILAGDEFYNVTEFHDGLTPFSADVPYTVEADVDTFPDGWYKILMNIMDAKMEEVDAFCQTLDYPKLRFLATTGYYYEILPAEVNKARGNRILMDVMGWQDKTLVTIGDFFNDIEMIRDADIGAAVGAAPAEIKAAADLVVCGIEDGAMADLIGRLEQMQAS